MRNHSLALLYSKFIHIDTLDTVGSLETRKYFTRKYINEANKKLRMKPSPLMTRIRQIWIMTGWLRHEAAAAAGMMVVRRQEGLSQDSQGDEPEAAAAAEATVGQVGVDTEGKLRKVRILDDYIVPFECGL
ncbi:uncharacterized protein DMAD_08661 [Drosophila madeirensis]|uniref:Uncharacterized protein n=1 Tax=Drosophila madeirensis TaxID=30013 RepID=A0AAU9EUZ7_DROMD